VGLRCMCGVGVGWWCGNEMLVWGGGVGWWWVYGDACVGCGCMCVMGELGGGGKGMHLWDADACV
jgi:hypothetical protein